MRQYAGVAVVVLVVLVVVVVVLLVAVVVLLVVVAAVESCRNARCQVETTSWVQAAT